MRVMFFHLPLKSTSHFCKIYLVVPPESHDIYTDRIQFTHFAFSFLNMFHYSEYTSRNAKNSTSS